MSCNKRRVPSWEAKGRTRIAARCRGRGWAWGWLATCTASLQEALLAAQVLHSLPTHFHSPGRTPPPLRGAPRSHLHRWWRQLPRLCAGPPALQRWRWWWSAGGGREGREAGSRGGTGWQAPQLRGAPAWCLVTCIAGSHNPTAARQSPAAPQCHWRRTRRSRRPAGQWMSGRALGVSTILAQLSQPGHRCRSCTATANAAGPAPLLPLLQASILPDCPAPLTCCAVPAARGESPALLPESLPMTCFTFCMLAGLLLLFGQRRKFCGGGDRQANDAGGGRQQLFCRAAAELSRGARPSTQLPRSGAGWLLPSGPEPNSMSPQT